MCWEWIELFSLSGGFGGLFYIIERIISKFYKTKLEYPQVVGISLILSGTSILITLYPKFLVQMTQEILSSMDIISRKTFIFIMDKIYTSRNL